MKTISTTPLERKLAVNFSHSVQNTNAVIKCIRHIDHVTYVTKFEDEPEFVQRWISLGFSEHMRVRTSLFPATHIALISGITAEYPWATMTGLSVSEDYYSPINKFVRRYGEGIQHTAYNIDPDVEMDEVYEQMKKLGWKFMTPVLTYEGGDGALLKQLFVAPNVPYGSFIEFAQRLLGTDGKPFDKFDTSNVDDLYQYYDDYSHWLENQ